MQKIARAPGGINDISPLRERGGGGGGAKQNRSKSLLGINFVYVLEPWFRTPTLF